jgi:uncharacterized protein YgiM (DUF1202 family)
MNFSRKKFWSGVLTGSLALSMCVAPAFAGQQAVGVGTVTDPVAQIHTAADEDSAVSSVLWGGSTVSVLGKSGEWYRISYDTVTGYLSADSLEYTTAAEALETTAAVVSDSAALMDRAAAGAEQLAELAKDTALNVSGFENGWYQVDYDGQTGFVRSDDVVLNGDADAEPSALAAAVNTVTAFSVADLLSAAGHTGTITGDGVCLRNAANADADVITDMNTGAKVTIEEKQGDWYKVSYDIHEGYVSADFVAVSPLLTVAEAEEPEQPSSDTSVIAVGIVNASSLRIREEASTDSGIVATLSSGDAVSIMAQADGWYRVDYDNHSGYMSADYLSAESSTDGISCYGRVLADVLNIRASASSDSDKVAGVSKDVYLNVSGFENGWYKVSYDGYEGYVSGDYITLAVSKPEPKPAPAASSSSGSSGSSSSSSSGSSSSVPSESSSSSASDVVSYAKQFVGVPYVYGGASPSGFDCSGFVMYVFSHFGYSLPHGATPQLNYGYAVDSLQAGDIVFFHGTSSENAAATHVGIYIGGGQFIHASSGRGCITISDLGGSYYSAHYLTARRLG